MMFFRKRTVPPTPPSFVKLYVIAASLSSGLSSSTPISDHVPELMYAHVPVPAGTAATADPVSCDAGAITGAGVKPVSEATDARNGPSTVPGCTMVPSSRGDRPNCCTRPYAHWRVV